MKLKLESPAGVAQAKTMLTRFDANERSEEQATDGLAAEAKRAAASLEASGTQGRPKRPTGSPA